jgi:hypothetical protein
VCEGEKAGWRLKKERKEAAGRGARSSARVEARLVV